MCHRLPPPFPSLLSSFVGFSWSSETRIRLRFPLPPQCFSSCFSFLFRAFEKQVALSFPPRIIAGGSSTVFSPLSPFPRPEKEIPLPTAHLVFSATGKQYLLPLPEPRSVFQPPVPVSLSPLARSRITRRLSQPTPPPSTYFHHEGCRDFL